MSGWLTRVEAHMTNSEGTLDTSKAYISNKFSRVGDDQTLNITYKGSKILEFSSNKKLCLENILVVPGSISKLQKMFYLLVN